jgi:hypothetical protein
MITLIPKSGEHSQLGNRRPITLLGSTNKIIAKTLARRIQEFLPLRRIQEFLPLRRIQEFLPLRRIQEFLPLVIRPYQSGFVEGRNILDNNFLAQEAPVWSPSSFLYLLVGARDDRTQSAPACLFFSFTPNPSPPVPSRGVSLALNLTLSANHNVSIWGSHIFYIISKNSSNKVTQLYWVIIFIPPIYTQTIVKWVAKEGEEPEPKPQLYPSPQTHPPKNLKI